MTKLSVVIITLNEEKNLKRCFDSVSSIADEIIVLDSFSTDKTKQICQDYNVNFFEQKFEGFIKQKNLAIEKANNDFILSLDADECLSEELIESIKHIKKNFEYNAYSFNRLTFHSGAWIRNCGWYPDKKIRLINKHKARWIGDQIHEVMDVDKDQNVFHLHGDLLHYSYPTIADHINQTNKFTTIAAKQFYDQGVRSSWTKIIFSTLFKFFKDYFLRRGFMDGFHGLVVCTINALSNFLKYSKILELQKNSK